MIVISDTQIVPRPPAAVPALRAADQGVADALEAVLSDHTRRVYGAQWRLFTGWCSDVDLRALPAEPLTVARYLAARAGSGASIATLRLATSAIAKVHEWTGHDSPCRDRGVREALKGWGRRLARPQRQAGALTAADVLAVIRLTAPKPRARGRGFETAEQAAERARFDLALVAVLSDGGLRRSEAASLTWGDVQRWDDGSGRITVVRSKTDVEAQGAVVAITPAAMQDFAHQMQWLVDVAYPDATVVRVVLDNLNTHRMASLYETFPPVEARRIVKRLEFHHTPKHASWLNMAEIEFSALSRACLKGRNPDADALQRKITAYETERNAAGVTINWRFSTQDARSTLHRLYPCLSRLD